MKKRNVRRIRTFCRQVFLALLVLCLVIQPVIAGQGALHEAIGHSGSSNNHAELHAAQAQQARPGAGESDSESSISHQLMHHAHCCAQPQLAPFGQMALLPMFAQPSIMGSALTAQVVPAAYSATPFRPPISG
ncbi:MAG: hypothetical protein J0M09_15755 [Xanthomonadales bacterium]|nr:hypothetical protein [Xanthomonadales bacterium]